MSDVTDNEPIKENGNGNGKKPLGRTQRVAIWAYATPFASVVLPAFVSLGGAIWRGDAATQLGVLDRLINFAQLYGLVAVGCLLGIGGAIKGVGSIAEAVAAKALAPK